MSAEIQPMLAPNAAAMHEHLEHLFGGYLDGRQDGRIELAWTAPTATADGRYALCHAETFDTDEFDRLVAKAIEVNSRPRTNVYIGAALRGPNTPPVGRCDDDDFYCATAVWCDLDDKDANDLAKVRFAGRQPSMVVRTGDFPHWRNQLWWRLTEPLDDLERTRALVSGISTVLGGDGTVANASRVMRLAGGIAWDQKPGRRPELTRIVPLKTPGLHAYLPDHLERLYPPLYSLDHVRKVKSGGPNVGIVRKPDAFGLPTGVVVDGRERHMTNVICARLIDYCGQYGAVPTPDELFEHAWDVYERTTDLSRIGRNKPEFMDKCRSTMRRFEKGKIRGAESLERAVASYQTRREAKRENIRHEASFSGAADEEFKSATDLYEYLDIPGIKALPDAKWVVKDLILEDALGFIYGPPGHGKTFVALNLALSLAYGAEEWWWGKQIQRKGLVVYVAREGMGGLKNRIEAWQRAHDIESDDAAFILIKSGINFMDDADVGRLLRTLEAAAVQFDTDPALIFVDTVSRVLPGAEENLQKDMTLFVAACDALRDRFKSTVIGVHHAGKNGDMRGSTVLKGAGDFVFKVEKADDTSHSATFEAEKIKDAEDSWSKPIELVPQEWVAEGVIDGERKSLVARPAEAHSAATSSATPDNHTCRQILAAMDAAWRESRPWSNQKNVRKLLYAPLVMVKQFGLPDVKAAERLLEGWLYGDAKLVSVACRDPKHHVYGLQVTGRIG